MSNGQEKTNTDETEKFVNLEDIAEHLSVSKDAIRNWIRKNAIPFYRVGKQYKFRISEINDWFESGKAIKIE